MLIFNPFLSLQTAGWIPEIPNSYIPVFTLELTFLTGKLQISTHLLFLLPRVRSDLPLEKRDWKTQHCIPSKEAWNNSLTQNWSDSSNFKQSLSYTAVTAQAEIPIPLNLAYWNPNQSYFKIIELHKKLLKISGLAVTCGFYQCPSS